MTARKKTALRAIRERQAELRLEIAELEVRARRLRGKEPKRLRERVRRAN